jgi:hypothetical protein
MRMPICFGLLLACLSVEAGFMLANKVIGGQDMDTKSRVGKLVAISSKKEAIRSNVVLDENLLMRSDIPESLSYIKKHANYTSYHLLLAVRKHFPMAYKEVSNDDKAAILCSALKNTIYLNDWGSLTPSDSYDGESAKALLEIRKVALKSLTALLEDNECAPLFGSEEATLSDLYKYRRKDFAYRYVSLILGHSPAFRADSKERDKDIETLKAKLKKDAK